MLRSSMLALSLTSTLAVACGGKGATPSTTTAVVEPADDDVVAEVPVEPPVVEVHDQAVKEGGPWTRVEPGTWQFAAAKAARSTRSLSAVPGGRGILIVDLPKGATGGTLTTISGHYTHAGTARWVVYPATGKDGVIAGAPLGQTEITVSASQIAKVGAEAIWTEARFDPPVIIEATRFHLVFEVVDGQPAVAADDTKPERVYYQGPKDKKAKKAPLSAHVRVVLAEVR